MNPSSSLKHRQTPPPTNTHKHKHKQDGLEMRYRKLKKATS